MARLIPARKTDEISVLDWVIVIGGIVGIMAFNRMSIARLQRSLPNVNSQIVGEWTSTRAGTPCFSRRQDRQHDCPCQSGGRHSGADCSGNKWSGAGTGQVPIVQGGKVGIQLMNGTKYTTTISLGNPNRFDLIYLATGGVTTYERVAGSSRQRSDHAEGAFPMISFFTSNFFTTIDMPKPLV